MLGPLNLLLNRVCSPPSLAQRLCQLGASTARPTPRKRARSPTTPVLPSPQPQNRPIWCPNSCATPLAAPLFHRRLGVCELPHVCPPRPSPSLHGSGGRFQLCTPLKPLAKDPEHPFHPPPRRGIAWGRCRCGHVTVRPSPGPPQGAQAGEGGGGHPGQSAPPLWTSWSRGLVPDSPRGRARASHVPALAPCGHISLPPPPRPHDPRPAHAPTCSVHSAGIPSRFCARCPALDRSHMSARGCDVLARSSLPLIPYPPSNSAVRSRGTVPLTEAVDWMA